MVDKVKPLKFENPATGGTETDVFPTEADPTEDYLSAKGIAFENSDTLLVRAQSNELGYEDSGSLGFQAFNDISASAFAARFTISLQHNGSVSGGTFFGYNELIPGNTTPIIIPIASILKGYSFSNSSAAADYTLYFRKNSTVATPFHSVSKVNTQYFAETITDQSFSAGDQIYVSYQDDGGNATDVGITLFFQAV